MLEKFILLLSLLSSGHVGLGTVFGSSRWDRGNPHSRLACLRREIDDSRDLIIAHNTLPCGSRVLIYNLRNGRSVLARVGDRGPRHAYADLSREVAKRIGHNGREDVLVVEVPESMRMEQPPEDLERPIATSEAALRSEGLTAPELDATQSGEPAAAEMEDDPGL